MTDATTEAETPRTHLLSNKLYDRLKVLTLVILPAFGTLYFALADIWGFPAAQQVVGSITALVVFFGVVIKLGDASYNASGAKYDGHIDVFENADKTAYTLNVDGDPADIKNKAEVTFKVKPQTDPPPVPPTPAA